jgi:tetratricopeptide (TPR) repeat protein
MTQTLRTSVHACRQPGTVNVNVTMKLHLDLLGTPIATLNGSTVELPPKSLALLAYLLIEGRSKRDLLAKILWPNVSANPRNNLSQERASLIKHLGFDALQGDPETLEVLEAVSCDLHVFRAKQQGNTRVAWRIYRGEFLKNLEFHPRLLGGRAFGEEYETWLFQQRAEFTRQYHQCSKALGLEEIQRGAFERAIPFLDFKQDSDQLLPEDTARLLMLCYGALGQSDQATAVFTFLSSRLQDDLGVAPMRLTREVFKLARSEPFACTQRLRALLPSASPPPRPRHREEPTVKFVGRNHDLRLVLKALRDDPGSITDRDADSRLAANGVRCVLLWGEPGVGKTRLVEESLASLKQTEAEFWQVNVRATPDQLPLLMVQRATRAVIHDHPEVLNRLGQVTRESLARFLPDLLEPNTTVIPPDLEQRALFAALRVVYSSTTAPTLLVLEDLHWADEGSMAFFEYFLSDAPEAGLLLLATARDSEPSRSSLVRFATLLRDHHGGLVHSLDGISSDAVQELATSFGQTEVNANELHRRTGGNPLFVLELLQGQDAGRKRLTELIQDRVRACGELAIQVFEAMAVVGDGHPVGVLRDVSGRGLEETIEALEVLEAARLLHQDDAAVSFRHDLIRELILAAITTPRRALLELRAARAVRTHATLAAQHYLACKGIWDQDTTLLAAQCFLDAGRQCASRGDSRAGLEWLEWAWKIRDDIGWRFDVTLIRARLLERYGQYRQASETLDRTSPFLNAAHKAQRASWWSLKSKLELSAYGDHALARGHAQQALIECGESNDPALLLERCRALRNLGWALRVNRDLEKAAAELRASLAIAQMLDDPDEQVASLHALGFCLIELRDSTALSHLETSLSMLQTSKNEKEIEALNFIGIYHERVENDYQAAKHYFERALDSAQTWGVTYKYSYLNNLATIHFYLHEFTQARDAYESALHEYRQQAAENEFELAYILSNLAEVEFRLGRHGFSLEYLAEARAILSRKENGILSANLDFYEGEVRLLSGDFELAKQSFLKSMRLAKSVKHPKREAQSLARIALLEHSAALAEQALSIWNGPATRASVKLIEGGLELAQDFVVQDQYELGMLHLITYRRLKLHQNLIAAQDLLGPALRPH